MRTFIKSCLTVLTAGFVLSYSYIGVADESTSKRNIDSSAVKKCRQDCKSQKESEAYERCMLKCNEDHKGKASATSPVK